MPVRRATPADAPELTRLRAVMIESWSGKPAEPGEWVATCEAYLRRALATGDFAAYAVDGPGGGLVSCGVGWIEQHLPGPHNPTGRRGHIANMSTDPEHRRQGHGRAVFEALLAWFDERGVTRVDLRATDQGEPLYRQYGFGEPGGVPLTRR